MSKISNAITMLNGKMNKEVRLGCIAHLVEDYVWFEKYVPSFAKHIENGRLVYLKDNSIHTTEEFSKDMYEDYTHINGYIINEYCSEYEELTKQLATMMKNNEKEFLDKNDKVVVQSDGLSLSVITKEGIDEYIKETVEKVEKIIKELMGE